MFELISTPSLISDMIFFFLFSGIIGDDFYCVALGIFFVTHKIHILKISKMFHSLILLLNQKFVFMNLPAK